MAYASNAEIEADFKDITFTASTNVKTADVTQFIVEADGLINSYVGTVYVVPVVVAGEGLNLLKLLCRSLVTARIKKLMEVKQETSGDANQNVLSVLLSVSQVMAILKEIQKKDIALAGAVALTSGGGFYSNNAANDVAPVVEKDSRQW
jgi:Holliday junction resolvasome RuvABC endonuclease subunit